MREDEIYEPAKSPLAAVPGLNRSAVGWRVIIVRGGPVKPQRRLFDLSCQPVCWLCVRPTR